MQFSKEESSDGSGVCALVVPAMVMVVVVVLVVGTGGDGSCGGGLVGRLDLLLQGHRWGRWFTPPTPPTPPSALSLPFPPPLPTPAP